MHQRHIVTPFQSANHQHARCRSEAMARAERACADRGSRLTDIRRRVLELVWESHEPVKAYDILARLGGRRRRAAPPTVYRALDFLRREGLVHRIESMNAYVGCGDPGHSGAVQFMICRGCGSAAELSDQGVTGRLEQRALELGFAMDSQTIEILGVCAKCGARQSVRPER